SRCGTCCNRPGAAGDRQPRLGSSPAASPLRTTPTELGEDTPQGYSASGEQHHAVKPEIGDLGDEPLISLAAERRRHDLDGLLADLAGDVRLASGEEARHVGLRRRRGLARLEDALENVQQGWSGAGRTRSAGALLG